MIALIGMTSERNVTSSSRKAAESTNAKTSGACDFIVSLKSFELAVSPVTSAVVLGTVPTVAGIRVFRSCANALSEAESLPLPDQRNVQLGDGVRRVDLERAGLLEQRARRGTFAQSAYRPRHFGRGHVARADYHDGRDRIPWECRLDLVVGLDDRQVLGQGGRAGDREVQAERGNREHHQQAAGRDHGDRLDAAGRGSAPAPTIRSRPRSTASAR